MRKTFSSRGIELTAHGCVVQWCRWKDFSHILCCIRTHECSSTKSEIFKRDAFQRRRLPLPVCALGRDSISRTRTHFWKAHLKEFHRHPIISPRHTITSAMVSTSTSKVIKGGRCITHTQKSIQKAALLSMCLALTSLLSGVPRVMCRFSRFRIARM